MTRAGGAATVGTTDLPCRERTYDGSPGRCIEGVVTRLAALALLASTLATTSCWYHIDDHCPGCTVLSERAPDPPRLRADSPATVLLVHGAFGFGDEWDQVVPALRKHNIDFVAWSWGGPWRSPPKSMARFASALQGLIDTLPPSVRELIVIAHSAGGGLIENAARRVRVPAGHTLRVMAIAPARVNLSAARDGRFSDEAMAQTVSLSQPPLTPVPPHVAIEEYLTDDAPAAGAPDAGEPGEPRLRRIYLGAAVGHNESVPLVALPAIEELARRR